LCVEAEVARVMVIQDQATFTAARRFPFYHGSHMEGTDEQKKQKYERNKAEFEKRKQQQQCFMCTMDALERPSANGQIRHRRLTGHENEARRARIQRTAPRRWYGLTGRSGPTSPPLETRPLARLQDPSMPPDPTPGPVAPRERVAPTRRTCRLVSVAA
jgi:hypothetical protein